MTLWLPEFPEFINPTLFSDIPTFFGQQNAIHCTSSADSLPVEAMRSNTVRGREEFGVGRGKQQCVLLLCHCCGAAPGGGAVRVYGGIRIRVRPSMARSWMSVKTNRFDQSD